MPVAGCCAADAMSPSCVGRSRRPHGRAAPSSGDAWQRSGVAALGLWPDPAGVSIASGTVRLGVYPTVHDGRDSVRLALHLDATIARTRTRGGLMRLAALALPQQHALVRRNAAARSRAHALAGCCRSRQRYLRRDRGPGGGDGGARRRSAAARAKRSSPRDWRQAAAGSRRPAMTSSGWCAPWRRASRRRDRRSMP